jgi:hypothetical protein
MDRNRWADPANVDRLYWLQYRWGWWEATKNRTLKCTLKEITGAWVVEYFH